LRLHASWGINRRAAIAHPWGLAMSGKTIDVNLVNPFIEATIECLTQMAGMQPARKRLFIKNDPKMHGDVSGVIGMSRGLTGSCMVSFPMPLARRIVGGMLMEDPAALTPEMVNDGIGEVANMVAGGARRLFVAAGKQFDISTPTVISGDPISMFNPGDVVSIAAEFTSKPEWPETFLVEVALKPTTK
jgi:chemotaxis protein CheX